ncbi:zinc-binding dehydrogenase [Sedimentitalea arenosa]|uniref:zinc-binding dehydrogenase n=1 Tax=Sedimentitalea arenosa TaxID=2798803 RepID=UPI002E2813C3|nr:zinc-binding dehydrogenase [Arenibacterium arenosum]
MPLLADPRPQLLRLAEFFVGSPPIGHAQHFRQVPFHHADAIRHRLRCARGRVFIGEYGLDTGNGTSHDPGKEVFPNLSSYIENDEIRLPVAATYPLEQIAQAQEDSSKKGHAGKIVLIPPQ